MLDTIGSSPNLMIFKYIIWLNNTDITNIAHILLRKAAIVVMANSVTALSMNNMDLLIRN